jgi:PAS domain S-box-containing protein
LINNNVPNNQLIYHDVISYLELAVFHTKLLTLNNSKLDRDINISAVMKNLEQALLLTEKPLLKINEGKNAQVQLENKNSQNDLDRIFNVTAHMVCIASPSGYFLKISPAFAETLGFSEKELLSKPFIAFVHPEELESTIEIMTPLIRGIPIIRFSNRYICKDGSYKWLEWTSRCFVNGGDIYAVAHDITERKKVEEDLSKLTMLQESLGVQFLITHSYLTSDMNFITKITNIVLTNITDSNFDVNALAQNVFMSRSTLQRKIKRESGISAAQFIRQARLARAHDFIQKKTHNTLTETAYAVGFKHTGYFSRLYKKYVIEIKKADDCLHNKYFDPVTDFV